MFRSIKNIYHLGVKELVSLFRDYLLLILIIYSFSIAGSISDRRISFAGMNMGGKKASEICLESWE